ncbi:hypothetical protein JCM6882_005775 [Rhodosporidiobolus microsporus]
MSAPASSSSARNVPPLDTNSKLSLEEIASANRRAQIDGVAAGTCAGFLGGFISTKMLSQTRNLGLLSGVLTGSIVGYLLTQESLKLQLAKARASHSELRAHLSGSSLSATSSPDDRIAPETWDLGKGERGVGGMEGYQDKYQTTRGDH